MSKSVSNIVLHFWTLTIYTYNAMKNKRQQPYHRNTLIKTLTSHKKPLTIIICRTNSLP